MRHIQYLRIYPPKNSKTITSFLQKIPLLCKKYNAKMKIRILLLTATLYIANISIAQQSLPSDLTNIRATQITDQQLIQLASQLKQSGYTVNDAYALAIARGMTPIEAQILKSRLDGLVQGATRNTNTNDTAYNKTSSNNYNYSYRTIDTLQADELIEPINKLNIFGAEIFNKKNLTFEPNLRMATPKNYILGPDDEVIIDIFGYQEANYRSKVTPDGSIKVPNVGIIYVNGLTIEQATNRITDKLTKNGYSNINSGRTKVQISLGSIRSIKVTLIGEARKPGTYTLPSLATVFNALYASGGPTDNGSFRNIQIIRANKIIDTLDIYDFLMRGDQIHNIGLADQDIIRVPPYTTRVNVQGQVKRPGIYEIANGEYFKDVLNFAGGFSDSAYTAAVSIVQNTSSQKRVADLNADAFDTYIPHNTDAYTIGKILDRYENRVQIEGAVFRPGVYEWKPNLTVSQLIQKAQGLKEDAFTKRGIIKRQKADLTPSFINFNIADIINKKIPDIILQKEDSVSIRSIFDLREQLDVHIEGEVQKPGDFAYSENMTLQDLLLLAGGFKEKASTKEIEISRRLKDADPLNKNSKIANIIKISTAGDIFDMSQPPILEPFDKIVVRSNPAYLLQKIVKIEGAVLYPGEYTLSTQADRVSTLLYRAGGVLPLANTDAAYILRPRDVSEISKRKLEVIKKLSNNKDSIANDAIDNNLYDRLALNLNEIIKNPTSAPDVFLVEGDILRIEKLSPTIKVSGLVYTPSLQPYQQGKSVRYYIANAGGLASGARKSGIHIVYPNGEARGRNRFLFFTSYPEVKPGSEIIIPKIVSERKPLSTVEVVGIASAIASLGAVVVAVLNSLKK